MGGVQERLPPDQAFGIFLATFLKRKYFKRLDHILPLNLKYLIVTYLETFLSLFRLQYEKSVELPYPPPPPFTAISLMPSHSKALTVGLFDSFVFIHLIVYLCSFQICTCFRDLQTFIKSTL